MELLSLSFGFTPAVPGLTAPPSFVSPGFTKLPASCGLETSPRGRVPHLLCCGAPAGQHLPREPAK